MSNGGYIMLHRRLLEHPLYKRPGFVRLWVFILGITQYKDGAVLHRGQMVDLKWGQFVIGERWAATETGLSRGQVRGLLAVMETQNMIQRITHRVTHRFSIFSVENWEKYQPFQPTEQPTANPQTNPQGNPQKPDEKQQNQTRRATHRATHTKEEDIRDEYKAATDVPAIYSALSRTFLEQQRKQIPKESVWKDFEARVAEGAKSLHLFHTQNGWTEEEIRDLLDWIPNDKDFWSTGIRTLGSIRVRKKGKGTPMKFENAAADMRRKKGGLAPSGVMTYDQMIAVKDEEQITTDHFQRIGDDQWKRK